MEACSGVLPGASPVVVVQDGTELTAPTTGPPPRPDPFPGERQAGAHDLFPGGKRPNRAKPEEGDAERELSCASTCQRMVDASNNSELQVTEFALEVVSIRRHRSGNAGHVIVDIAPRLKGLGGCTWDR
jgi:hypothetical protein